MTKGITALGLLTMGVKQGCCGVRVVEGDHNAEGSFHMVMIR